MTRQKESPVTDLDKYLRIINLRTHLALELLKKCGSEDQIARYARGAMSFDELLTMARAELFAPFDGIDLKRFAKSREIGALHRQLTHLERCPEHGRDDAELHEISIVNSPERSINLTGGQQRHLHMLMDVVAKAARHEWLHQNHMIDRDTVPIVINSVLHVVSCAACRRDAGCVSAKVSIRWAEHVLVREWLL